MGCVPVGVRHERTAHRARAAPRSTRSDRSRGRRADARAHRPCAGTRDGRCAARRAAGQGRDARGSARVRLGHACARAQARAAGRRTGARRGRHRRRCLGQLQPIDRRGAARRGHGRARGQARQPLGVEPLGQRGSARGARAPVAARRARGGRLSRRHRIHLSICAALPPGDERGGARASRARRSAPYSIFSGR